MSVFVFYFLFYFIIYPYSISSGDTSGCIVSLSVQDCRDVDAVVKYLPSKNNEFHSEIHSSDTVVLLNKSQRFHLSEVANEEYMEEWKGM